MRRRHAPDGLEAVDDIGGDGLRIIDTGMVEAAVVPGLVQGKVFFFSSTSSEMPERRRSSS